MSQGRLRKGAVVAGKTNGMNGQVTDDSRITKVQSSVDKERSNSKSKIPKSIRYELENALVGLCDVWFEEIKPHLVRNNIKLHVPGSNANRASGDYETQELPSEAPHCSHLDPGAAPDLPRHTGANYVSSCLTQPTASKVPSFKQPARSRLKIQLPLQAPYRQTYTQDLQHCCEVPRLDKSYAARNHKKRRPRPRPTQTPAGTNWRVPRLCRTYSVTPSPPPGSRQTQLSTDTYHKYFKLQCPKVRRKDKSTQTELSIHIGHVLHSQPPLEYCRPRLLNRQGTLPRSLTTNHQRSSSFLESMLIQDKLNDSICEEHENRLQIIYNNPRQVFVQGCPSEMNLLLSVKPRKCRSSKRNPWR